MDAKRFIKCAAMFALLVIGIVYLASAILVADRISALFFPKAQPTIQVEVNGIPDIVDTTETTSLKPENQGTSSNQITIKPTVTIDRASRFSFGVFLGMTVYIIVLLALLSTPVSIFYFFLLKPLQNIPLVSAEVIQALNAESEERQKEAGLAIGEAMIVSPYCPEEDKKVLASAIERPSNISDTIKKLLSEREAKAKRKAFEIATMAGLTAAASSSSMGDGLGMFFWKSKLVYETFRIYGFRPNAKTTVSIWTHVVFASFLSASVEELCELFDVSALIGGVGARILQCAVGGAVVLKGGELTRSYLVCGISSEVRSQALARFRGSLKDDLLELASTLGETLSRIGLRALSL